MGSKGGGAAAAEMEKMSVDELKMVKEQSDLEVNLLQDSLNNIRTATSRLDFASTSLLQLSLRPQGKKMLVPLTALLYVPATLDDADNVQVDVGTGYFVEKTMAEGKDYCQRKINLLKSNYEQLLEASTTGNAVDQRRRNRSPEGLEANVRRLKTYKAKLVVFPRNANKFKDDDSTPDELANAKQVHGDILPLQREQPTVELVNVTYDMKLFNAFAKLRLERTNKRHQNATRSELT